MYKIHDKVFAPIAILWIAFLPLPVFSQSQAMITLPTNQVHPQVVAGSGGYLMVWEDYQTGIAIQGQRLSLSAQPSGEPFLVSSQSATTCLQPRITYNDRYNEFLVVWQQEYSASDHDICAQRISPDGIRIGNEIAISRLNNFEGAPVVAYNPLRQEYLVVWQLREGNDEIFHNDIVARRINAVGELIGDPISIAYGQLDESSPSVVVSSTDSYLIAWQEQKGGVAGYDIQGLLLSGEGYPIQENMILCNWEYDQIVPQVAYNPLNGEFLTIWEDHHWGFGNDWDIYGQRISPDGFPIGSNLAIAWLGSQYRLNPVSAFNPLLGEFLVGWESEYTPDDHDIYVRRIGGDGMLIGDEEVVSNLSSQEAHPAIAGGGLIPFLVVWEDNRNDPSTGVDIYGSPWGMVPCTWDQFSPDVPATAIAVTANIGVQNTGTGLAVTTAQYCFSTDGGQTWNEWMAAHCTGIEGSQQPETITAATIFFGQDSSPDQPFQVRFRIADGTQQVWESPAYPVVVDSTIPTFVSGPGVRDISAIAATIVWQTSEITNGEVFYGSTANLTQKLSDPEMDIEHSMILANLEPGTAYQVEVRSEDTAGNLAVSRRLSFTTLPPRDRTPPTVTIDNPGTVQGETLFSAQAEDDIGVERVIFFMDGLIVGTDFAAPFDLPVHSGNYTNGPHQFSAQATDKAGKTATVNQDIDILNVKDVTVPTVTITAPGSNQEVNGVVKVKATLSDDVGLHSTLLTVDAYSTAGKKWNMPYPKTAQVELDWDTTKTINGRYRLAVTAYDGSWKTGQALLDVIVHNIPPPPPPQLAVIKHQATRNQNYFTVQLTIRNTGGSEAKNIAIRDNLILLQPIGYHTLTLKVRPSYQENSYSCDCIITSTLLLAAGAERTFSYEVVPILEPTPDRTPMIGNFVEMTWDSDTQPGFNDWLQSPVFKTTGGEIMAQAYDQALKASDYLLVTSPPNLSRINPLDQVEQVLSGMAELARWEKGALGFLDAPLSLTQDFQLNDGLVIGNFLYDAAKRDEIIIANQNAKEVRIYRLSDHGWYSETPFKLGNNEEGFQAGDRLAIGNLGYTDYQQLIMADASADRILIYTPSGEIPVSRVVDFDPYDGLAAGDVIGDASEEVIVADRSAGKFLIHNWKPGTVSSFNHDFQTSDGLAVADVLGLGKSQIILADDSHDKIDILAANGNVLCSFPCFWEDGHMLTAGDVGWDGKAEIVVGTRAEMGPGSIIIYSGTGQKLRTLNFNMQPHNLLTTGNLLGNSPWGSKEYVMIGAYQDQRIFAYEATGNAGNPYVLIDLLRHGSQNPDPVQSPWETPKGYWAGKLADTWTYHGYLLLVGENEIVPSVGGAQYGTVYTTKGDYPLKVDSTDFFYANTWGDILKPELAIGRIIGNNAAELRTVLETSIAVVRQTPGYNFNRSFSFCVSGYPSGLGGGADTINFQAEAFDAAKILLSKGVNGIVMNTPDYTQYYSDGKINASATKALIQNKFFQQLPNTEVLFLSGHGNAEGWDVIGVDDILARFDPFGSKTPFVYGASCLTGRYIAGTSPAEAFLQRGAGVYFGAVMVGLGSHASIKNQFFQNWDTGESVALAAKQTRQGLGDDNTERYWNAIYHVFGDPKFGAAGPSLPPPDAMDLSPEQPVPPGTTHFVDLGVPSYQVEHRDDGDYVTFLDGGLLFVHGQPLVPYYRTLYRYPMGTRIQQVTLSEQCPPQTADGFRLVLSQEGIVGQGDGPALPMPAQGLGWWPEKAWDWTTWDDPEGVTLAITVYPFYYHIATGQVRFYPNYRFQVETTTESVALTSVRTEQQCYPPGQPINIEIALQNDGDLPTDVVASVTVKRDDTGQIVEGPGLRLLRQVSGPASCGFVWDTTGQSPGYYTLITRLTDSEGHLLDERPQVVRLTSIAGEITAFTANPSLWGANVSISMTFYNSGSEPIDGIAEISIQDTGGIPIFRFQHELDSIQPNEVAILTDLWDSASAPRGEYRIVGQVRYDGKVANTGILQVGPCIGGRISADLNDDCTVDLTDLIILAEQWMKRSCGHLNDCKGADLNGDTIVDLKDWAILAQSWK